VIAARNTAVSAEARAAAAPGDATAMKQLAGAEAALTGTLGRLFALAEAYPNLKADSTMNRLMEELTSTENRISFARQSFNDSVMHYNTAREQFPTVIVASMFNFGPAELFAVGEEEKQAPNVKFT
jgi:LemA protein